MASIYMIRINLRDEFNSADGIGKFPEKCQIFSLRDYFGSFFSGGI